VIRLCQTNAATLDRSCSNRHTFSWLIPMKKFIPYLVIAGVAAATIAIIFRVTKLRNIVTGQA
jgi:hypothetical protein